ncbi:MAG TPA: AMP-binding protein [Streptosporangiaceae bacterium]|nr:AMP-binding protein [Streptosporangiaceae bacterium]
MDHQSLLSWLERPPADRGIRFAVNGSEWDFWSYGSIADSTRRVASGLRSLGIRRDDVVSIVLPAGPGFVAALFGTMLAGAVPSPLAPPMAFRDLGAYDDHVAGVLRTARPRLVVTDLKLTDTIGRLARLADVTSITTIDEVLAGGKDRAGPARPASLALLQFTSGSSGRARGVRIGFEALEANVSAIREWLLMTAEDATATWLPVHHDMGLIGCLLTPVVNGSDIWLMQPEQFVHSPVRYLQCFGESGARLTAMPAFGLAYIARRVSPAMLEGFDFSQWRAVIVGAERLDAGVFDQFHRLLAPFGLQRSAILPAYGLAEATLAVTALPLFEGWRSVEVRPGPFAIGDAIARSDPAADGNAVVGCGRPLAGATVTVVDERGQPLPHGHVGEIVVRAPSVASGYVCADESSSLTSIEAGRLATGDAGFLLSGELYVLGRLGDSLKVRGRAVFAEDIEAALATAGLPGHRLAVALGIYEGRPTAVAVLEHPRPGWTEVAEQILRRRTDGASVVVAPVGRGAIARTSSGKPKRRLLWHAFVGGTLVQVATRGAQGSDAP